MGLVALRGQKARRYVRAIDVDAWLDSKRAGLSRL